MKIKGQGKLAKLFSCFSNRSLKVVEDGVYGYPSGEESMPSEKSFYKTSPRSFYSEKNNKQQKKFKKGSSFVKHVRKLSLTNKHKSKSEKKRQQCSAYEFSAELDGISTTSREFDKVGSDSRQLDQVDSREFDKICSSSKSSFTGERDFQQDEIQIEAPQQDDEIQIESPQQEVEIQIESPQQEVQIESSKTPAQPIKVPEVVIEEDTKVHLPFNWEQSLNPRIELNEHGDYRWIKQVGHGSFGLIALAQDTSQPTQQTGKQVVVKFLWREGMVRSRRQEGDNEIKRVQREICYHKALSGHPNIIEFKETFLTPNFLCIVMEYADGGDMFNFTFKRKIPNTEGIAKKQFMHLVRALCHCHSAGIVHRDLKLENCLRMATDKCDKLAVKSQGGERWNLKLCDFGYTKHLQNDGVAQSRVGSMPYASPEVIYAQNREVYDGVKSDGVKRDVWSLGVFLFILLSKRYPFDPSTNSLMEMCEKIRTSDYKWTTKSIVSESAKELVAGMLNPDPKERFSLQQIIAHPWLTQDLPRGWKWYATESQRTEGWGLQSDDEICQIVNAVFLNEQQ